MRLLLTAVLSLLLSLNATAAPRETPPYSFGVAPQFDQRQLFATWRPVLDRLEKMTGQRFNFISAASVPEFELAVSRGTYDFIYVNPFHLYKERSRQGYIPLVRDFTPLRGIVTVRQDSAITTLAELDGKTLAVPSPNALGASMLVQAELARQHGVTMKIQNAQSHSSAYLYAVNKLTDAAGGVEKTLSEQEPAIRGELRVIFRTHDFPSHPIAVHPRIPKELRQQVKRSLLGMAADPAGRGLLENIPIRRAVAAAFRDYEVFGPLDLDAYWTEPAAGKPRP